MKQYTDIHRRQLFHWIGYHIDYTNPDQRIEALQDTHRKKYVDALKGALTDGLWAKKPRNPDRFGNEFTNGHFEISRPIICFTEWLVGESLPHTTRYGRLGLGFPRKFVLNRGGHPVVYVRGIAKGDQYTKNVLNLRDFLKHESALKILGAEKAEEMAKRLDYLAHFVKQARRPSPSRQSSRKQDASSSGTGLGAREPSFKRLYGKRQEFLEEREWRIVYHPTFKRYFEKSDGSLEKPEYYLPFKPGADLFTVVLPDNKTVNMVMNEEFFIKKFYPPDGPHVTVLSLEDVGTF